MTGRKEAAERFRIGLCMCEGREEEEGSLCDLARALQSQASLLHGSCRLQTRFLWLPPL